MRNFQEDVRKARRKTQDNAFCRFDTDPAEFTVYELSAHGFSFLCSKETCFFKKEAMLEKISIFNAEKLEIIRASGRVMHVAEFDFQKMRVGVFYTKKTLDRTISGKVRVPRKTPKIPLNAIMKVKVKGAEQEIPGQVMDFTASTARIGFNGKRPDDLEIGDEITVAIHAEDSLLYDGLGYVLRKRDEGAEIIIQFAKWIDSSRVETETQVYQNRQVIFSALDSMQKYDLVKEEYKALISDWRLYLSRLKQVLDNEELKNTYRNESDKELFLKSIEDRLLKVLHGYIHQMNRMVESLSKQESTIYKKYYRENLNPLLRSSPLISSIIDKDLGYAGDFETIKLFFQNPYSGDTLFGKFVNKYLCSLDAVTAHVDRIRYISDQLCFAYKNSANDFSFLALGAGPAEEVLRFVENNSFEKPVFATLIDMDAYALADFSDRMQYLPKKNFTVDLQNLNVINLIRNEPSIEDRKYDLSYCAGMFDYFSDTFCKRLIKYLIKCTKPDGVAMFTNVSKDSMARYVMDYCGGWEIIHRNNAEIVALIPQEYHYELSHDEKKANIYAKIIVPKRNG